MLSLELFKLMQDDREREIRRTLRTRELLHREPEVRPATPCVEPTPRRRQEVADAAS